jgi:branched-chain amino acid transport system permease protein
VLVFLQQVINGIALGSIYALVAVAFTLSIGVLNFLNFSLPAIFMVGGMLTWAGLKAGIAWPLALLGAIAGGAVVSLIVERFTYRWMRSSSLFIPLVSSMAFLILIENLVLVQWGSDLQPVASPFPNVNLQAYGLIVSLPQLIGLALSVLLVFGLAQLLARSRIGRGLRTMAESSDTALILGVDVARVVPAVFVISGLFTALGGVLFALTYKQVHPFMGQEVAFKGISAMVIGGMGNVWGAIIGGLLIGIAEVMSIRFLGADMVNIAVYGLLLVILFVRPTGLFGGRAIGKGRV